MCVKKRTEAIVLWVIPRCSCHKHS